MAIAPLRRFLPDPDQGESTFIGEFLRRETVGGGLALVAAGLAQVTPVLRVLLQQILAGR